MTTFDFDVTANGRGVTNLVTGQVNQGCTPPAHIFGGEIDIGNYVISVASDGSFALSYSYNASLDGSTPTQERVALTGHFSGATAVGTLEKKLYFTYNGIPYECGSGLQNWTVTRTG